MSAIVPNSQVFWWAVRLPRPVLRMHLSERSATGTCACLSGEGLAAEGEVPKPPANV